MRADPRLYPTLLAPDDWNRCDLPRDVGADVLVKAYNPLWLNLTSEGDMATPALTSAFFRRIAGLGCRKGSSNGELLASVSALWLLILLLVPILIAVFC